MRWDKWLQGLIAAFVTGVSNGFTAIVVDPSAFNFSDAAGMKKVATMAIVSGLIGFFLFLKQHPTPDPELTLPPPA